MALTDVSRVVGGAENKLWCPVVTRTNVRNVGLSCDKDLGAKKRIKIETKL
jgi:hypothetical protein